ncbi:MAG TPA: hypothetical protein VND20_05135 [Candidatus Binataceae bacterium]|nr:hypothetical protein [Candidatus Binataceae bacterium]
MSANHQPASLGAAAVRPFGQPQPLNWGRFSSIAVGLVIAGIVGVAGGLLTGNPQRVWLTWLVDLLFFMGIAQGGVVCSAAFYLTQGRWAGSVHYRMAEAWWRFVPLAFVLFAGVFIGRDFIFPWIAHPSVKQAVWLNVPFLFARDYLALGIMALVSWWFVSLSQTAEATVWHHEPMTIGLPPKGIRRLAPALCILYAITYTLFAYDLISSLSPRWHSTLFGWWYFATVFWSNIVAMNFAVSRLVGRLPPGNRFTQRTVRHDFGKMIFAFSIFWMYLTFAQYIVIWYGDLPAETFFVIARCWHHPWMLLTWLAPLCIWVIPFFTLLSVRSKTSPTVICIVALLGLFGVWDLNYILIVPSLSPNHLPLGWIEVLITAGFLGAFMLCAAPGLKLVAETAATDVEGGE